MWESVIFFIQIGLTVTGMFLLVYSTIARVVKIERKFKKLLPGYSGAVRLPPFFEVSAIIKPPSKAGVEFLLYRKQYVRQSLKIIAVGIGMMTIAAIIKNQFWKSTSVWITPSSLDNFLFYFLRPLSRRARCTHLGRAHPSRLRTPPPLKVNAPIHKNVHTHCVRVVYRKYGPKLPKVNAYSGSRNAPSW